ncbi:MarR family winged helix-turn-helix transcriptional regulator [Chloroflexota bacterium]
MGSNLTNEIIELLIRIPSTLRRTAHREFFKTALKQIGEDITAQHLMIMRTLEESGPLHVSEIGSSLLISNSQMTHLTDKLISLGLIERQPDYSDRRTIIIILTSNGEKTIRKVTGLIRNNIEAKLSAIPEEELETLSTSLKNIVNILAKIH